MADGVIRQYYVPLYPATTTANGDTACTYAIITPLRGDSNPTNNIVSICDVVRNSWDPNAKTVLPEGQVSAGSLLTYTIDFENDGNDTAFNIHVQDTLSEYLNTKSFQLLSATHRVEPYLYETTNGKKVLKFDFQNINLPGKHDSIYNTGQVRFTIRMKDDLADGTVIANRAGIYFDGNPVVLTDYAYSQIPQPTLIEGLDSRESMKVFPNPANGSLYVQVLKNGWEKALLSNTLGQVILQYQLNTGTNTIDMARLPTGIYYLKIEGSAGAISERIEKR